MDTIKIICPNCGTVLGAADDPANERKMVICPGCKVRNRFVDFKRLSPKPIDDVTEIQMPTAGLPGSLVYEKSSKSYPLREGRNLVGRKPLREASDADIQIETSDRGFSRSHLYIDVMRGRDGRWHSYVSNADNKNETLINCKRLGKGEMIGLKDGDRICSSETVLRFVETMNEDSDQ